jgi:Cu(I)/Ag(I) efflux system membrane fusion protein
VEKLYVKSDGERVKKGDILFDLYSRELVNAQEEYIQALQGSNDYLKRASRERLEALGMNPAEIRRVERKRRAVQQVPMPAEQDGVVHGLNVREGMYVQPKTEIMTLADLSSVWLLVDVFERQADWVAVGQPAEVRLTYLPGRVWEGEVEFIYPTIDPKTRTLQVRLRFDNPDEALKPGMFADVRIYAGPKRDVLSIPREALIKAGRSERVILSLGDGRFAAREVMAGIESGDWVEIISGLNEGDEVVTSGQFLIDSEASLKASFSRMGGTGADSGATMTMEQPLTGTGTVNEVFADSRKVNITHAPIEALGWPEMTMDFALSDAVDPALIRPGSRVEFTLLKTDSGRYLIDAIQTRD